MTTVVFPRYAGALLPGLGTLTDDEGLALRRTVDPNDEAAVRAVLRELVVSYYELWDGDSQRRGKDALRWYLNCARDRVERVWESMMPPIDPPDEPALVFEWLWAVLFGDEAWRDPTVCDWQVDRDPEAANTIRVRR